MCASGTVIAGGAEGTVSSLVTITAGALGSSLGTRVGGIVCGRAEAYVALERPDDSPPRGGLSP